MSSKTLIIDDDDISIMLTDMVLEATSFAKEIHPFSDGTYALDYLKAEYTLDANYIIILDINMPLMNGWQFLEEIKSFASKKNTCVFMLSSSTDRQDIEKSENIDLVKGFFSKPLTKEHLRQIEERIES